MISYARAYPSSTLGSPRPPKTDTAQLPLETSGSAALGAISSGCRRITFAGHLRFCEGPAANAPPDQDLRSCCVCLREAAIAYVRGAPEDPSELYAPSGRSGGDRVSRQASRRASLSSRREARRGIRRHSASSWRQPCARSTRPRVSRRSRPTRRLRAGALGTQVPRRWSWPGAGHGVM